MWIRDFMIGRDSLALGTFDGFRIMMDIGWMVDLPHFGI